jgi:arsenate reductase (glutaredoxin)
MTIELYGIPNCDTVKRARQWLAARGAEVQFHDFKKLGVPPEQLDAWLAACGWQALLNRKGSTWRALDAATQAAASDEAGARALMLSHSSVIKRPVVRWPDGRISVGFGQAEWTARLAS